MVMSVRFIWHAIDNCQIPRVLWWHVLFTSVNGYSTQKWKSDCPADQEASGPDLR